MACWNCGSKAAGERGYCSECGQPLAPDDQQRERAAERIDYLIRELRRWKSVPEWWKEEAEANYRVRLETLSAMGMAAPEMPLVEKVEAIESEPPLADLEAPEVEMPESQTPAPEPVPLALSLSRRGRTARALDSTPFEELLGEAPPAPRHTPVGEEQVPSGPNEADLAMKMLVDAFSEKKIRLLYALGGILLLSAGVGTLRSSWDGWGRQVMALLLTALPLVFFWLASQLRERLPVSSRMFTVLGGAMLPIGVLFLNTFNVAGLQAPAALWNPLAFFLGWFVNLRLARKSEPICTYLSGLCWGLAGWSSGSGLLLGIMSFAGAFAVFRLAQRDPHSERVGHALSALGLLAAFTRGPLESGSAATLFLLAIVYFAFSAWMARTPAMLVISSLVCVVSTWWMSSLLDWPHSSVGLAALIQGSMLLLQARPEEEGAWARRLAIYMTAGVLVFFLGFPLALQIVTNFSGVSDNQLLTCTVTGVLATIYYTWAGFRYRRPSWIYGASLSALYAYFTLLAFAMHSQPHLYRPWLIGFVVLWQVAASILKRRISSEYLRPWVWTAAGLSMLMIPLNIVLQLVAADAYTPWIYLGVAAVTTLSALFERDPRGLYLSMITAALAYATWLPIWFGSSRESNLGFAFAPFVTAMALLGLFLSRRSQDQQDQPNYGSPLLLSAALAGWCFSLVQGLYLMMGYWSTVPPTLIYYGLVAALLAWKSPSPQWGRYLSFHASLCFLTALASIDRLGTLGLSAVYLTSAVLLLASRRTGWSEGALLWLAVSAWLVPSEMKIWPGLIFMGSALFNRTHLPGEREKLAMGSFAMLLPAWMSCWQSQSNWGLLLASLGQLFLAFRFNRNQLLALAWLQLKVCYLCAFGWAQPMAWTLALWTELGVQVWLNTRLEKPEVTLEGLTTAFLLTTSAILGGLMSMINPWLVAMLLLYRGIQIQHAGLFYASQAVAFWACVATSNYLHAPALLPMLLTGLSALDLALTRLRPQVQTWALQSMLWFSLGAWLPIWFEGFKVDHLLTLASGALIWGLRAVLTRDQAGPSPVGNSALWVTFGFLYHAYLLMLVEAGIQQVELVTVPLAAWLLFWGSRLSDSPGFRQVGLLGMLVPSLVLSLFSGAHALWAGSLGVAVLVWGQAAGRGNAVAWGGLAVLLEVVIQAVLFATNLPWHLWALGGGFILVSMAFFVERKRREVLEASRAFMESLNTW